MLQTEFETLTGIFPDAILYEVIEREYSRQIDGRDFWDNKHDFCNAYKFNEDGLASRLQAAANEAIWRKEEAHRKAMQESAERIESLARELHDRKAYCEMLEEKLRDRHPDIITRLELAGMHELMDSVKYDAGSENVGEAAYTICGVIRRFQEGGSE
ncbi:MAG: hypothetical protein IJ825_06130 [Oscillospiraceae bacterium]|nr:hypothetical protein [Oscillospiraceae bacterium]